MINLKLVFVSFLNFLKTKKFLGYVLSILLFALVFVYSGYALTNNPSFRTYSYVILVLFAFCLFGYYLLTIPIPEDKKNIKEILFYLVKKSKTDVSFYYLIFVIVSALVAMVVNSDFNGNAIKTFITHSFIFIAAFSFTKVISYKTAIRVFRSIFPWLCIISLGLFGIINFFGIEHPFMSFATSTVQYDNFFFIYFRYVALSNRNCSIFWEPALFALFICAGVIIELVFTENRIRIWVVIIYLISIFTTFSSSGFVLFIVSLIAAIIMMDDKIIKKDFVRLIILTVVCLAGLTVVVLLKPSILEKFLLTAKSNSLSDRLYGPLINFKIMLDHPFGVGFSQEYSYFVSYAAESQYFKGGIIQTCTFGYWASAFGFLGLMFTIAPMILIFFNKKMNLFTKITLIPLSLAFMMTEPIQNNLAFLILLFYCLNGVSFRKIEPDSEIVFIEESSVSDRLLKNPKNSVFVKNSLSAFIVKGFAILVSLFATAAYIDYFLDPKGEGMLAVWFTILSVLTWILVFDLGVGHGLKNKLVLAYEKDDKEKIKTLISSSYFFAFVISLFIFAAGSLVIWLVSPYLLLNVDPSLINEQSLRLSLWIILIAICLNFILKIISNIFESIQKQGIANLFAVFNTLILVIFVTTFAFDTNEERMMGIVIAYLIASTIPLLIGSVILFFTRFKAYKPSPKSISRDGIRSVVSLGGLFFIIQICMLLINNTNTIIIQHIYSGIEAGATAQFTYYQKIFNIVITVAQLLSGPIWVIIAKAKSSGDSNYIKKMNKILFSLICVFIVIDFVVFAAMPLILEVWIPNSKFDFSWTANAVFAINSIIVTTTILFSAICNGLSKLKYQTIGFIIGLFIKITSVTAIILLKNQGHNIPWYFMELSTTLAYLPSLILIPIGNHKYLKESDERQNGKVFFFSYFSNLVKTNRNAPLAAESVSLYVKELLDSKDYNKHDVEYINLAHSRKAFCIERNQTNGNNHQIGTVSFGKLYRHFIWKKNYWKKIYRFCKKTIVKSDVMIIYHSLYTNHLLKKIKENIGCKVILIGAEIYSDVSGNKKAYKFELESYEYANAHILISDVLKKRIGIERPSLVLSGDYRLIKTQNAKFSDEDGKIHLVYAGTFDDTKGGAYVSINAMKYLSSNYVLHILGFGDKKKVLSLIKNIKTKAKIVVEDPLRGEEFINYLSKCDVGLSLQDPNKQFNNSSFPSKIITYAKCGLAIVSTRSISVINSPFEKIVSFVDFDDKTIANAIKNVKNVESLPTLKRISNNFAKNFSELLNNVFEVKRVLITNNCYGGSTGNISREIASYLLDRGQDVKFCYLVGKDNKELFAKKYGNKLDRYLSALLTRITGNNLGYMFGSTAQLKRITERFKPDLVNVHCMNAYSMNNYSYFEYLKENSYKAVIVNHGLFYATGSCGHPFNCCEKYKSGCGKCPNRRYACKSYCVDRTKDNWLKMYRSFDNSNFTMVSVSPYVKEFCKQSPITARLKNYVVANGIDTSTFKVSNFTFKDHHIHILHVSSDINGANKGFDKFVEIIDALSSDKRFVFHLVCRQKVKIANRTNLVIHQNINKKELAKLYSKCNLYLITSKNETFSLPVAESVCCGTPVAGYRCGGPESILNSNVSRFFKFGDTESIVKYIKEMKYVHIDKNIISEYGHSNFSNEKMLDGYYDVFTKVLRK